MPLKYKLMFVMLAPILVLSLIHVLGVKRVIYDFEATLRSGQEHGAAATEDRIKGLLTRLSHASINLSRPREIRGAVQAADNEVLYDWADSFIGAVDNIVFADTAGLVLARAPDEFSFGDSVVRTTWFADTMINGVFHGLAMVDGVESLVSARLVQKYGDVPVGVVCVAVDINQSLLARLVGDEHLILRFEGERGWLESSPRIVGMPAEPIPLVFEDMGVPPVFSILSLPDTRREQLDKLRTSVLVNGVVATVLTCIVLMLLLTKQLGPYTAIVKAILQYSRNRLSLDGLRGALSAVRNKPTMEITQILDALINMVDSLKSNFKSLDEYTGKLESLANTDTLTGLHNRKFIDETLAREVHRSVRYRTSLSILILDIDHFKQVNDSYGHQVGDLVLTTLAGVLEVNSREVDVVGRWGGEEFLVVSPGIGVTEARFFAEKLRLAVLDGVFPEGLLVTISIGVSELQEGETVHALVGRADEALYQAKDKGRNCVCGD